MRHRLMFASLTPMLAAATQHVFFLAVLLLTPAAQAQIPSSVVLEQSSHGTELQVGTVGDTGDMTVFAAWPSHGRPAPG